LPAPPPPPLDADEMDPATERALRTMGFLGRRDEPEPEPEAKPEPKAEPEGTTTSDAEQNQNPKEPTPPPPPEGKPEGKPEAKPEQKEPQPGEEPRKRRRNRLEEATNKLAEGPEKLAEPRTPPPPPPVPAPSEEDQDETERLEALAILEKTKAYAGRNLRAEYKNYLKRFKSYQDGWEAEHQGEEFDPEADEHSGWMERNSPDIDEEDVIIARSKLETRREVAGMLAQERAQGMRRIAEAAAEEAARTAPSELPGLLDEKLAGKSDADVEKADPLVSVVLEGLKGKAALSARLATQLCHPDAAIPYNSEDERHVWVRQQIESYEKELAALPLARTGRGGKKFGASGPDYQMPEHTRDRHWTIYRAPDVVRYLMLVDLA